MSMNREISQAVENINRDFNELKSDLQKKHEKLVTKEHVDAMLLEKMDRINDAITKSEDALEAAEKAQAMAKAMRIAANEFEEKIKEGKRRHTDPELRKAFVKFIKQGEQSLSQGEADRLVTHTKSLSSGADPSGGYVVMPEMDDQIIRILYETSPMRQIAEVKQISTDQFERLVRVDLPACGWADRDASDSTAPNTTPTFQKMSVKAYREWAEPAISQDLIDDAYIDVEAELTMALATAFELQENTAFISGNGVGQPRGILSYGAGSWSDSTPNSPSWNSIQQVKSTSNTTITYAGIVNLVYELKDGYHQRAKFLANRLTVAQMRLLVDGIGRPLWEPGMGSEPALFMGYPIIRAADMPLIAQNALSIAFGDFSRGYLIVDRIGTRVLRDPFTNKPFINFYTTKRVGGMVQNFEAIKLQIIST